MLLFVRLIFFNRLIKEVGWIEKLKFETTDLLCGLNKANVNFGDVEDCGFLDWIGLDWIFICFLPL